MIQAENLSLSFQGQLLFDEISFSIQRGEKCGLVGRNGTGKTTLLRLIIGQEMSDSGHIHLPKHYKLGYLQQHIRFTQATVVAEAMTALPAQQREETYRAEKILFGLGFKEEDLDKSPEQLSGGFSLRLNLTKVLLSEPDFLLLDEPTNYLDLPSMRWLTRFLKHWQGELLLISHDREFMDNVITHTMGLHRHKLHKIRGTTIDLFTQIALEEEIHERTRQKSEKTRAHAQAFIDRFGAKATKAAQAQSRQKMLARIPALEKLKELYNLSFHFQEAPFMGKKMLQADGLSFSYPGQKLLIQDFSLTIEKGERIAIIGKNGCGKSTLLRLLAQELIPQSGSLTQSTNVSLGYFGQTNVQRLEPLLSIEEEIAQANPHLNLTEVRSICGLMMFGGDLAQKKIGVLSGGEKSRVLLGKILAKKCNLLFLDEPTHHLDIESIEALIDALEEFEGSVIIVTHSELILNRLQLDKVILCHEHGQQSLDGTYEDFLAKIGWPEEAKPAKAKHEDNRHKQSELMRALQTQIKRLEKEISHLEEQIKCDHEKLIKAAQAGQNSKSFLQETQAREHRLQALYAEWEEASLKLDQMRQ